MNSYSRTLPRSFAASVLIHTLIGLAILMLVPPRQLLSPDETAVNVEILRPEDFRLEDLRAKDLQPAPQLPPQETMQPAPSEAAPQLPPPPAALPESAQPAIPPAGPVQTRIQARQFLSGKVLADPRSRGARAALKQLAAADQVEQLCNIEAMEQVRHWDSRYAPEFVVSYAMADPTRRSQGMEAGGAAFLSRQHWYEISFRCEVTPDLNEVTAFEFQIGRDIPQEEWESHSLFLAAKQQD